MLITYFSKRRLYSLIISYVEALIYMLSSITKKGEIESTFAPLVVLVINVNILCGWTNVFPQEYFRKGSTVAKQMEKWNPQNAKDMDWQKLKTLHFWLSDPRSH